MIDRKKKEERLSAPNTQMLANPKAEMPARSKAVLKDQPILKPKAKNQTKHTVTLNMKSLDAGGSAPTTQMLVHSTF